MNTRRDFLRSTAVSTLVATTIPGIVQAANGLIHTESTSPTSPLPPLTLQVGQTVLFQGDSITDAGRNRGNYYANNASGMGSGYVQQIVTQLLGQYPERDYRFYNRGISGHKVYQLADRWDDDCLNLKPDVLSLLIGVNDYWHGLDGGYDGTAEVFDSDLRQLIARTRTALPNVKLIIGEPFAVSGGTAIDARWDAFKDYRAAAKQIASDNRASFVPYHEIFDAALALAPASYWCPDGVHPSMAGCYLMKEAWVSAFATV